MLDAAEADSLERFARVVGTRAALGVLLAILVLGMARLSYFRRFEDRLLDRRITLWRQLSEADTSSITLVTIDQESLDDLHMKWPLPRSAYGRIIDRLRKAGADAIGITVLFQGSAPDPRQDQLLQEGMGGQGDVVLASRVDGGTIVTPPFPCSTGYCDVPLDGDGVARQFTLSAPGTDPPAVAMALALLRARYQNVAFVPRGFVAPAGSLFPIAWAGPPGHTFATVPLKRVLGGGDLSKDVKGKVVLVGSTLPASSNDIRTPFTRRGHDDTRSPMTAVELSANLVFTLLGGDALTPPTTAQAVLMVAGMAFLLFMLFGSLHPLFSLVCVVFVATLWVLGATYEMIMAHELLPLVPPLLAVVAAWLGSIAYRAGVSFARARAGGRSRFVQ